MEFLVARNYGKFTVGEQPSKERISVMISPTAFENLEYGGVITLHQASLSSGMMTFLRFNPGYRHTYMENWTHTDDGATILVLLLDMVAYIVIGEDHEPVLVPRDYSGFEGVSVKCSTGNVLELSSYR